MSAFFIYKKGTYKCFDLIIQPSGHGSSGLKSNQTYSIRFRFKGCFV